jgi:CxxC motif-containing protein (DUF1111 family)
MSARAIFVTEARGAAARWEFLAISLLVFGCASADPGVEAPDVDPAERLPGGDTTNTLMLGKLAFQRVASNATAEHESMFYSGNAFFNDAWVEAPASTSARDGLGPLFNARSCSTCHFADGRGAPPEAPGNAFASMLLRVGDGSLDERGAPGGDPVYGGQIQPFGVDGVPAEGAPRVEYELVRGSYADGAEYELLRPTYAVDAPAYGELADTLRISPRVAPHMIGLGLLEAVPEGRLRELADPDDADGDGISGKLNRVWDRVLEDFVPGRFGWKAEQPTVRQQVAGAFLGDLGVTSSLFPEQGCSDAQPECQSATSGGDPELEDELLLRVDIYSRLLAVPVRERWNDAATLEGKQLFEEAGCASCHTPRHETGTSDLEELAGQVIFPYTDLLLHDLGAELGDERPAYEADGNEWRTPPLWGIGRIPAVNGHSRLLHDGRARGVAEAILWHGGEASAAREVFLGLSAGERQRLVAFVESL